jgi:methylmalonyl-CoA/ethylmalonyl-CoA epimerase
MTEGAQDLVFDHIGIIVGEIDAGSATLDGMLGKLAWTSPVHDAGLGVSVRFARDQSGLVYELIAPFGERSPIARTLKSKANLLNHIAYRTHSIERGAAHLRMQRALPVSRPAPACAFGGANVQFFMTPLGFIIELIEIEAAIHLFDQ